DARRIVSVPCTGPRQVVPLYSIEIASGPCGVPVPVREKLHDGTPGVVAVPAADSGIVAPPSPPVADPEIVMLPAHTPEKSPAIDVAVWLVTRHSRLPHVEALGSPGSADDNHVPM